jgi:hypothetical protein
VSDPATGAALIDRTVSMFSQTAPSSGSGPESREAPTSPT